MIKIIIISGKQGSGKTTVAKALVKRARELKFDFIGVEKFAGPLYQLHDYILNKMEGWTGQRRVVKNGPLLQYLGTEFGRKNYGDNVWIDILRDELFDVTQSNSLTRRLVIIDDCRFENEFNAFPEALRVRLECNEAERKMRADCWRDDVNHPSEIGLDVYANSGKFDMKFDTSGNLTVDQNVEHCVSLIFSELNRGSWIESRDPLLHNRN